MDWERIVTADGSPTLVHPGHGEACHSRSGAWLEARERYARACRLRERALERRPARLRLLDVGTGLGFNVAAALEALAGTGVELAVTTLELERAVLARALEPGLLEPLSELERWHAPVRAALHEALSTGLPAPFRVQAGSAGGRLELRLGDARATLPRLPASAVFDAVFLDGFSPRVAPELWEAPFLAEIARRMAPGSWLSTFTVSLRVRARLAAAGLRVGPGGRVGDKAAGTLASPDRPVPPFPARLQRRLARRAQALRHGPEIPSRAVARRPS